jgi:tRNA pseudouridine38-40 synthase
VNACRQATEQVEPRRATAQTWKLVVAYDGTDFRGWQIQPGVRTVQGELAQAVFDVTGERVLPQGSGRTDRGVHAQGQAVSLALEADIPPERLLSALNRRLHAAVRVVHAERMHADFHARARVVSKTYEYRVFARRGSLDAPLTPERVLPPWQARFAWDCRYPLSLERMEAAAEAVVGTFDFSSFAAFDPDRVARLKLANGAAALPDNVRTIFSSAWSQAEGLLLYRVSGSGFLYHMVRNLVGTFVEIGSGRMDEASLPALIATRDRSKAGPTAPPQGLFLMDVVYKQSEPAAMDDARAAVMA